MQSKHPIRRETGVRAMFRQLGSSTIILTVGCLILFEFGMRQLQPLKYFNHTGLTTINQNFLVSKLPELLSGRSDADLLLMGSSLVLFPSVRCDDEVHGVRTRYDRWYIRNHLSEYTKADYLQGLIEQTLASKVKVVNLAVAASLISDQYLILRKYFSSGKHPQVIVLAVAPRDFMDNLRKDVEKTPTYSILADFSGLEDLLKRQAPPSELFDFVLGTTCLYYKNRSDYSSFFSTIAAYATGHPVSIYAASQGQTVSNVNLDFFADGESRLGAIKPDYTPKKNSLGELGNYKKMYLPVSYDYFSKQVGYLEKFLTLARERKVPVLIVDVPLPKENMALLPDTFKDEYREMLRSLATKYDAHFLNPQETNSYTLTDFEDCAHMNSQGGKKLFTSIANEISLTPLSDKIKAGARQAGISSVFNLVR